MEQQRAEPVVVSVSSDGTHAFSKPAQQSIELVVGWGCAATRTPERPCSTCITGA